MKHIFLIAACLLISGTSCSQNLPLIAASPIKIEKKATYTTGQPYYQVDFSAAACLFEIRVNDIVIFKLNVNGQTSTNLPINQAILQSGKQQITVKILPLTGKHTLDPNAEFKYNIKVFDAAKDMNFKEQLPGGHTFPPVGTKPQAIMTYSETFTANVPYSIPTYDSGTDLKSVGDLNTKIRDAYQQVANLIAKGDYEGFKKLIANRESIAITTSYLSPKESADRVNDLIKDFKSGFKIEPIPANAVVSFEANGKIASLKRPSGDSALYLSNKKTGEEESIDLSFFIPQGKKELEIR